MRALLVGLTSLTVALAGATTARAGEVLQGLVEYSHLAAIDADSGALLEPLTFITALPAGGFTPVAMDMRPANGRLYLLAFKNGTPDKMQLLTVDPETGVANVAGNEFTSPAPDNTTAYAMDFNPTVDRLRVISLPTGATNFRINPDTGQPILPVDTGFAWDDGSPSPIDMFGIGYSNNVAGAASTVLYGTEATGTALNLVSLSNPNGGQVHKIATIPRDTGGGTYVAAGFDISETGVAYILPGSYTTETKLELTTVNLTTGELGTPHVVTPAIHLTALRNAKLGLSAATAGVAEAAGTATLTVSRTAGAADVPATVEYATADGSATAGTDYSPVSGTLSFAAGETSKTIAVPVTPDTTAESAESFVVFLSAPRGSVVGGAVLDRAVQTVSIADDDTVAPVPSPTPTPTPTPTPDTTKASLTLKGVPSSTTRAKLLKGFTATITPSEAVRLGVVLQASLKKATASSYELGLFSKTYGSSTAARTVKVKPKASLFGRPRRSVKVRLRIEATDTAGNVTTTTRTITVKPR